MRICVLHRYPRSLITGTNPSFDLFLRELIERGHSVALITLRESEPVAEINRLSWIQLPYSMSRGSVAAKLLSSLRWCFGVPFRVRREHRTSPFDMVYCDDSLPLYGWLVKLIAGVTTIIRLGDLHSAYQLEERGRIGRALFRVALGLEKAVWRRMDGLVPISEAFKRFLVDEGMDERRIGWVQECIDLDFFMPRAEDMRVRDDYGIPAEAPLIMFHGLVAEMKGIGTLIRAMPQVLVEHPTASLLIVGDGPSLPGLRRLAATLDLDHCVQFAGWVAFSDVPRLLASATVGVPCRSGNLGNHLVVTTALLQYWAMEKPVVAPDLDAISNSVKDGENGYLFAPGDAEGLADALSRVLDSPEHAERMGRAGRKTAADSFDIHTVSSRMSHVLTRTELGS